MYIYIYMYTFICIFIYVYICMYIYIYSYVYMYTDIYTCIYTHTYIHIYICIYVYLYIYLTEMGMTIQKNQPIRQIRLYACICMYIQKYTCMHIYIQTYIHICLFVYICTWRRREWQSERVTKTSEKSDRIQSWYFFEGHVINRALHYEQSPIKHEKRPV